MKHYFPAAAMSTALKLISFFASLLILGVSYQAYLAVPPVSVGAFTHTFGMGVVTLIPAIFMISLLLMVRGYSVSQTHLYIHRLFWLTAIPLEGLNNVEFSPDKLKGSIRIFGNGGLFAFTGLYQNKTIGRYRLFATDFACAVTLFLAQKTVVITPAQPQEFVDFMRSKFLKL